MYQIQYILQYIEVIGNCPVFFRLPLVAAGKEEEEEDGWLLSAQSTPER